jgi:hypothetical protein
VEARANNDAQREVYGELLGLCYAQGALEAWTRMKTAAAQNAAANVEADLDPQPW